MTTSSIRAVSALAVALALALSACTAGDAPWASEPHSPRSLPGASASPHAPTSAPQAGEPVTDINQLVGTWGTPSEAAAPGYPFIVISADGTASGSDGCNSFGGLNWVADASAITFSGGIQTLAACPHIDQWLNQRTTATVNDEVMTFFDEAGTAIGTLPRTG